MIKQYRMKSLKDKIEGQKPEQSELKVVKKQVKKKIKKKK